MDCHSIIKGGDEDAILKLRIPLMGAIWTIIVADAMMSIDNVIGVVGAVQRSFRACYSRHVNYCSNYRILPLHYLPRIINKFLPFFGLVVLPLGWVVGEMIVEDPLLIPYIQGEELLVKIGTVFFVLIVTGMIKIWKKRDA